MGAPGYQVRGGRERPRVPSEGNPYYTEEALRVLAAVYSWNEVQRLLREEIEKGVDPEEAKQDLMQPHWGAEAWMFEPLPESPQERERFFSENAPKTQEELQVVFPRYWLIKPEHVGGVQQGVDPFNVNEEENPNSVAIIDADDRWKGALLTNPETGEQQWRYSLEPVPPPEEEPTLFMGGTLAGPLWALAHHGVTKQWPETRARLAEDTAARLRGDPEYQRGYWEEMGRLQDRRGDIISEAGGYEGTFGAAREVQDLAPRFFRDAVPHFLGSATGAGQIRAAMAGVPHQLERTTAGGEVERGKAGRLGVAEARQEVARRMREQQSGLERAQQEYDAGELSAQDYQERIGHLLGLQRTAELQDRAQSTPPTLGREPETEPQVSAPPQSPPTLQAPQEQELQPIRRRRQYTGEEY